MPDPLAGDVHREPDQELVLDHLERRRMTVAHQVPNQAPVVACGLRALTVGDARGLDDRRIVPHVVHERDETVGEDGVTDADLQVRSGHRDSTHRGGYVGHGLGRGGER